MFTARVITVSDRSYRGERPDAGGPLVKELLTAAGYEVDGIVVVPDEDAQIRQALRQGAAEDVALIVTTGGTGFSPRDRRGCQHLWRKCKGKPVENDGCLC